MSRLMLAVLSIGLLALALVAGPAAAQETAPAAAAEGDIADAPHTMAQFRDELQRFETEVVSKTMSFSTDEATAFWPVFKQFQAEQREIIDGQIAAVTEYAEHYATLSEDDAVAYVEALLERDQRIHDLRIKYLAEYGRVIGRNKAARVIQISRRVGLASQAKLSEVIPLVH